MKILTSLILGCLVAHVAVASNDLPCEVDESIPTIMRRLTALLTGLKLKAEAEGLLTLDTEPVAVPTVTPNVILPTIPHDCKDIQLLGNTESGTYVITHEGTDITVYCDMETEGGGWTVIQWRKDGTESFDRTFAEYASGFGDPTTEMWLGNEKLAWMTITKPYELYIKITDFDGETRYAKYGSFAIKGVEKKYALTISDYTGTAGNSFGYHNGAKFSTIDIDNDASSSRNCAEIHHGGWWFKNCLRVNLNGLYLGGEHDSYADGIEWSRFRGLKYSLKETVMMIRPATL